MVQLVEKRLHVFDITEVEHCAEPRRRAVLDGRGSFLDVFCWHVEAILLNFVLIKDIIILD